MNQEQHCTIWGNKLVMTSLVIVIYFFFSFLFLHDSHKFNCQIFWLHFILEYVYLQTTWVKVRFRGRFRVPSYYPVIAITVTWT